MKIDYPLANIKCYNIHCPDHEKIRARKLQLHTKRVI